MKNYDRAYFDRWYRHPLHRVATPEGLRRKVRLAVATAEYLLARPMRTVLDVGCGEGAWRAVLKRLRPGVRYIGVETSEYVIRRFGTRRNIRRGSFGSLRALRLPRRLDLIVCADVLQYLTDGEIESGLAEIRRLLGGVAYVEAYAAEDAMEGDRDGWHDRPASAYRAFFRRAGLVQCGPHCYLDPDAMDALGSFERL